MPPQHKLHKKSGKSSLKKNTPTVQVEEAVSEGANAELDQQFETELCWCIQQLQLGLKSQKLSGKQVDDYKKALNTLMSNSTPIIKKRQVMRLSFGDYREKMEAENKCLSKASFKYKLSSASPSKKSVFIRKSAFASSEGNTFKFNFNNETNPMTAGAVIIAPEENTSKKGYRFIPTDNSFRFNFDSMSITNETDPH